MNKKKTGTHASSVVIDDPVTTSKKGTYNDYLAARKTLEQIHALLHSHEQRQPPIFIGVPQGCESVAIMCEAIKIDLRDLARFICSGNPEAKFKRALLVAKLGDLQRYCITLQNILKVENETDQKQS